MLLMKKLYTEDIMNLAIILSLLKLNSIDISMDLFARFPSSLHHEVSLGSSYGYYSTDLPNFRDIRYIERAIPSKSINSEFHENVLFSELSELGSFNRDVTYSNDIYAYLSNNGSSRPLESINADVPRGDSNQIENGMQSAVNPIADSGMPDGDDKDVYSDDELTPEDANLIEVLWKQDIDLGVSRESYDASKREESEKKKSFKEAEFHNLKNDSKTELEESYDAWGGLNYTIDTETGEYILLPPKEQKPEKTDEPVQNGHSEQSVPRVHEQEFMDLLDLLNIDDGLHAASNSNASTSAPNQQIASEIHENQAIIEKLEKEIKEPEIAEANYTQLSGPSSNQTRLPLMHGIEERWQDVANLLDIPNNITSFVDFNNATSSNTNSNMTAAVAALQPSSLMTPFQNTTVPSGAHLENALIENATLPSAIQPLSPVMNPANTSILDQSNFTSVVTSPLTSLTNGTGPNIDTTSTNFTFENTFFPFTTNQTNTNVTNHTTGFLSSLISDEDLEFMGISMNDSNCVENANRTEDKVDVSSDSAVSSMSPDRFPAFSDGEWFDSSSETSQQDHHERFFGTEVSAPNAMYRLPPYVNPSASPDSRFVTMDGSDGSSNAQKKYKFFGKRILQESPSGSANNSADNRSRDSNMHHYLPDKTRNLNGFAYNQSGEVEGATAMLPSPSSRVSSHVNHHQLYENGARSQDYVFHNHTYGMPPGKDGGNERPSCRDKISRQQIDNDKGLSRDERRAKELMIPLTVEDIVNMSMDEFNEKLSKYELNETQLTLIRDIRRRGKNKVAAQNCRKRKLDQIYTLEDELKQLHDQKSSLEKEKENLSREKETSYYNFLQLHDKILRSLMLRQQQLNVGQPYANPENYTLQLTPDGNVYLAPRNSTNSTINFPNTSNYRHPNNPK